jgi:hypothetical protein
MSSTGRSSQNGAGGTFRPSYREATRNALPPASVVGAHTQHFTSPAQVSGPIPRKASVASSYRSTSTTASAISPLAVASHPPGGSGSAGWQAGVRRMSADAGYVSSRSADALLSDVKPLSVDLVALGLLNEVLDELLLSLVYRAGGLAPTKLKNALPAVLPNPLSRAAVEEAELELLSWFDSPEGSQWRSVGELPLGRGRDWSDAHGREGAGRDAGRLMRVMTQTYSVRPQPYRPFALVPVSDSLLSRRRSATVRRTTKPSSPLWRPSAPRAATSGRASSIRRPST